MSDQTEIVKCAEQGSSYATFVCQHIAHGSNLGFFCSNTSEDPRPDAWCGNCETMVNADGGWNEENEATAQITLLCVKCYDEAKARNLD